MPFSTAAPLLFVKEKLFSGQNVESLLFTLRPPPSLQMHQPSPGSQSSCSSEPSPLGTNHDSGVETAAHSGGSLGELSPLDDLPFVESLGLEDFAGGGAATVGLHLRKQLCASQHLQHLKKETLKTVRESCRWASKPTPPILNTKLPPIPAGGECRTKFAKSLVLLLTMTKTLMCSSPRESNLG